MRISELSERSGVSVRNLKRYIQLGLLRPPVGRTRAASYSEDHLKEVTRIQAMQREGRSLEEIGQTMAAAGTERRTSNARSTQATDLRVVAVSEQVFISFLRDSKGVPPSVQEEIIHLVSQTLRNRRKRVKAGPR
jgi:DNA-binding transcriptional MerR regulator